MKEAEHSGLTGRLRALDSCAVSDALDRLGCRPAVSGVVALSVRQRIAGRVITVKLGPGEDFRGTKRHLCTSAIEAAEAGDIVVVEQRTGIEAAGWGGILSRAAKLRQLAGVVVEGYARDIDEARDIGFPVYARGATSRTARGRIHEVATGEPVLLGDVVVATGDYLLADDSGLVILPAGQATEIVAMAEIITERELAMTANLLGGEPVSNVMGASYENMLKGQ